jgi:hypothetical protein
MNVEEYLNVVGNLNLAVMDDPTALLALTVAWLDPLSVIEDLDDLGGTDLAEFYYSGDDMGAALRVSRDCFSGIYAEAISKIRDGVGYQQTSEFISTEIADQTGIPIDQYEEPAAYAYGIPMPFYGAEWMEGEFIENNPELTELAVLLGATREQSYSHEVIEFSSKAYQIAHIVSASLWEHYDNSIHRSLMFAIAHCVSLSGNSSVDYSYEIAVEWQCLSWTPEEVDFASSIIREAEQIMTESYDGLLLIENNPHIRQTLIDKIEEAKTIVDRLQKKGKTPNDYITEENQNPFGLRWNNLYPSTLGDTSIDTECVQLWVDAA